MDASINAPIKKANVIVEWVWFGGSTAIKEGQGVCYDWDYEEDSGDSAKDDTVFDARRTNRVEVPTILNAPYFAGVASRVYSASSGGQFIEIYKPGSVCNVWSTVSNTIGVGRTTCQVADAEAGAFGYGGFAGQGSAKPLQTIDRSNVAGVCMCKLEVGEQSGLQETITTVTLTTAGGAVVLMVGGVTFFEAATLTDADATFVVADGTYLGQKKGWVLVGAMTTNNLVFTYTSAIQHVTGETGLATWTADTADEEQYVEWHGTSTDGLWIEKFTLGGTIA